MKVYYVGAVVYEGSAKDFCVGTYTVIGKKKCVGLEKFYELQANKRLLRENMVPFSRSGAYKRAQKLQEAFKEKSGVAIAYVFPVEVEPKFGYRVLVNPGEKVSGWAYPNGCRLNSERAKMLDEGVRELMYEDYFSKAGAYKHIRDHKKFCEARGWEQSTWKVEKYPIF